MVEVSPTPSTSRLQALTVGSPVTLSRLLLLFPWDHFHLPFEGYPDGGAFALALPFWQDVGLEERSATCSKLLEISGSHYKKDRKGCDIPLVGVYPLFGG